MKYVHGYQEALNNADNEILATQFKYKPGIASLYSMKFKHVNYRSKQSLMYHEHKKHIYISFKSIK